MKKNNKMFEEQYNSIMKHVSRSVRTILERLDEDELEESFEDEFLGEMARAKKRSTLPPKLKNNVNDMLSRAKWNIDFAINIVPLAKFDQQELLMRYVYALLKFGKQCPKSMNEIEETGIFKNYAYKFLKNGGTIEEIQELFDQQDPIDVRDRKGSTRSRKAFRGNAEEIEDFDGEASLDKEETQEPEEELVDVDNFEEPAEELEEPEAEVELEEEPEAEEDFDLDSLEDVRGSEEDYPAYDDVEVEKDDEDRMWDEFFAEDDEEESNVNERGEITTINDLSEIGYEEWMDPKYNLAFTEWDENKIILKDDNKKIGIKLDTIVYADHSAKNELIVWGTSFGDVMSKYKVFTDFMIDYMDCAFVLKTVKGNVIHKLSRYFQTKVIDRKQRDALEDYAVEHAEDFEDIMNSKKDVKVIIKEIEAMIEKLPELRV